MVMSPAFAAHPEHRIAITPHEGTVAVTFNDVEVARTKRALVLREASYPPVFYIPFADCAHAHFAKTGQVTTCPFKGRASYWTLSAGDAEAVNAVWGYENPFDQVAEIAGHVAFYPDKVMITS